MFPNIAALFPKKPVMFPNTAALFPNTAAVFPRPRAMMANNIAEIRNNVAMFRIVDAEKKAASPFCGRGSHFTISILAVSSSGRNRSRSHWRTYRV